MRFNNHNRYFSILASSIISLSVVFMLLCFGASSAIAQGRGTSTRATQINQISPDQPLMRDYKGVTLGMTAAAVRAKLGDPKDKGNTEDFYSFSENEMAQIFYDSTTKVRAIVLNYLGNGAPSFKSVLGSDEQPKPDGSLYKLVRFEKSGFWISYNRSGGDSPLTTVTLQRIQ